jgi:biotin carboxyl carrier protein
MKIQVKIADQTFDVEVGDSNARPVIAEIDGQKFEVWPEEQAVVEAAPVPEATSAPRMAAAPVKAPVATSSAKVVVAPLPGVIDSIKVKTGDSVNPGQELLVIEAMKMKNSIKATRSGKIAVVHVTAGDHVPHGAALVEFAD